MVAVDLEVDSADDGVDGGVTVTASTVAAVAVDCVVPAAASARAGAAGVAAAECSFIGTAAAAPLDLDAEVVGAVATGGQFSECSFVGSTTAVPLDLEIETATAAATAVATVEECSVVSIAPATGGACMLVESGSESDSSSSSARSRSRERRRGLGAAAAAALVTAAQPLDVDEAERVVERRLALPTEDAMQLQQEGGIVSVMAATGTVVGIAPGEDDVSLSTVCIAGNAAAVGKAVWEVEQLHKALKEKRAVAEAEAFMADMNKVEELRIPSKLVSAVIGNNGCDLPAVRSRCGGIMIAVCPPAEAGGDFVACLGPGDSQHVDAALLELSRRLREAGGSEKAATAPDHGSPKAEPCETADEEAEGTWM